MQRWLTWIDQHAAEVGWLAAGSVLVFVVGLLLAPLLAMRIPVDYFARDRRPHLPWSDQHWFVRGLLLLVKNLLGLLLIAAGLAMLVLPGQGILTLLAGVLLMDFPGKFRLERWLVTRGPTLRTINWLRQRGGQPPLEVGG